MANITFPTISLFTIFISFALYQATATATSDGGSVVELSTKQRQPKKIQMRQKLSHFTFYWHDVVGGPNATAIPIVKPVSNTSFGAVFMIDDLLTKGPELSSKPLGRAQGFYAGASLQKEFSLLMAMNFVFKTGKYNGSTITIMGRNAVANTVREMPVIGGTGLFRFGRGYVEARTNMYNAGTGDATFGQEYRPAARRDRKRLPRFSSIYFSLVSMLQKSGQTKSTNKYSVKQIENQENVDSLLYIIKEIVFIID